MKDLDISIDGKTSSGKYIEHFTESNQLYIRCENAGLKIYIISEDIIRFRFIVNNEFLDDFSYSVISDLKSSLNYSYTDDAFYLSTSNLDVIISKDDLLIKIFDKDGFLINEDERGFHFQNNLFGGYYLYTSKFIKNNEFFYGLGDKPTDLNLFKKKLTNWNSDTFGFESGVDPIYRSIPFYIGLHSKQGYGIFLNNSFRTWFDFGNQNNNVMSFWADGGELDYYFIYGPKLLDVSKRYTTLTGTHPLPPLWALGYQQCKWSYFPDTKVKEIAQEFRNRKLPCDVIYLDIDYMDGFRCFTWDLTKFPEPHILINDLHDEGFKMVVIIDPGIKVDYQYQVFQDGLKNNVFCRRTDGPFMAGDVWPGRCFFPDFTNPTVREWWSGLFHGLFLAGVDGIWNDMNEPAVFGTGTFPDDVRHDYDGRNCSHRKAHNVYGMQMARATRMSWNKFSPSKRPFVLTRAGFSGFQRDTAVWTGDNLSTWEHLWLASIQCQRLSISGASFCGTDVGGFSGEPNGELFTRWVQLAIFHPFFRSHSTLDTGDKEPWVFEEHFDIIKKFIELRYQLLPYIYTVFRNYSISGFPMLRPIVFIDQDDPDTHHRNEEFALGDLILTSPILKPNATGRWLYLPKGGWFNFWTDEFHYGGMEIFCDATIEYSPIFIKSGGIIPFAPIQQFVGEKNTNDTTLHIYFGIESVESELYQDSGEGFEYQNGNYLLHKFVTSGKPELFEISHTFDGNFYPNVDYFNVVVHGMIFLSQEINCDGTSIQFIYDDKTNLYSFNIPIYFHSLSII